jgi:hypothetical protein
MKSFLSFFLISLLIFLVSACSKKETGQAKLEENLSEVIESLKVDPAKPHSNSYVRAMAKYKTSKFNHLLRLKYEWLVNGKVVPGVNSKLLDKKYFKKKDSVRCILSILQGNKTLKKIKTKKIQIANSPPKIMDKPLPKLKVPGMMLYQIEASDPDDDELEYKLVAPLDLGIDLDVQSGLISWNINDGTLSLIEASRTADQGLSGTSSSEKDTTTATSLAIQFQVSDGDGGLAIGKIHLEYSSIKNKPVLKIKDDVRH